MNARPHRAATRSRRRWIAGALLAGACGIALVAWIMTGYRPPPGQVSATGDAVTMGRHYGQAAAWHTSMLVRWYLRYFQCRNRSDLIQQREAAAEAALAQWPIPYRLELMAFADAADLPPGAVAYGNSFLDMGASPTGCRSLVATDGDRLWHGHNLDWDDLAGLARWTVTIVRRHPTDGRLPTVAVGFPGLIGALDIANAAGVTLSFNQLGRGSGLTHEPVFLSLRRIAETCTTFNAARQAILSLPPGMPFIITLSAADTHQAAVFERLHDDILERPLAGAWIGGDNQAHADRQRPSTVLRAFDRPTYASATDVQAALADPDVLAGNNLYSVVFDHAGNRLYIASGKIPAAGTGYREYPLFTHRLTP